MSFADFSFNRQVAEAIRNCGFQSPTPIQQQAIAPILERRDLLGLAQTGTGKTAAFVLPTIQHLLETPGCGIRALVVAPTRELVEQINDFIGIVIRKTRLKSMVIYGRVSKYHQIAQIRKGVDIVVACPGRLLDILNDRVLDLTHVDTLVLDEADHMFDRGFLPDIRKILARLPKNRQSLVFSATMPDPIRILVNEMLRNPVTVQIHPSRPVKSVSHRLYAIEAARKTDLLIHLLKQGDQTTTLVFTRTKFKARNLAAQLEKSGFRATSLQGNLSQARRQQALEGFRNGKFDILVATDIAARGIDVIGISHVINYDVPDTVETYIHRTGRTGRATLTGEAVTFATEEDGGTVRGIERSLEAKMQRMPVSLPRPVRTPEVTGFSGVTKGQPAVVYRPKRTGFSRNASGRQKAAA